MTEPQEGGILIGLMLRVIGKNFINLIYPLSCLICKRGLSPLSDKPLCQACWEKIEYNLPPFCRVCGKHLPAPPETNAAAGPANSQDLVFICRDCQTCAYFFKKARAVCIYDGIIKECIHLFKYKSKLSLLKPLTKLMIDFAHNFLNMKEIDLILPVPLHSVKQRQRQFNQAHLLAKPLRRAFGKEVKGSLLIKIKSRPAQVNLAQRARLKNTQGAFKVRNANRLVNKNILLVDDVLTTGATANECARMLLQAGAQKVDVFALARSA